MKNSFILSVFNPKTLKKSRGGYSQNLLAQFLRYIKRSQVSDIASVCSETDIPLRVYKSHANNAVTTRLSRANHALCYADYQGVSYGSKGKRFDFQRCMRYAAMLLLCFVVGVGNVWGIDWNSKSWIACSGPCYSSAYESYKYNINSGSPNVVEIQYPDAWASACGIYITFSTDVGLSVNTLTENTDYTRQGAGIIFYLSYFTAQETTVTGSCNGSSWSFTIYNKNGSAGCTAPSSVGITGTNKYLAGQTISLTATPVGGSEVESYQWQKEINSVWTNINNGSGVSGATTNNLQISSCDHNNSGQYRCVVSTGATCSTNSGAYGVHVFSVYGRYYGGEYSHNEINWTSGTTGTATIHLNASSTYQFKVWSNDGYYYGNGSGNYIIQPVNWDCGTGNESQTELRLFTGPEGDYTFTVDIEHGLDGSPYVNVQVAYPSVTHPATGYVYLTKWWDCYPHFWDGSSNALTPNGYDPLISTYTTICGTQYWYMPALDNYTNVYFKNNPTWASATQHGYETSTSGNSGKYYTHDGSSWGWHSFTTYTISFAAGDGSGSMSSIAEICPGSDQALPANTFTRTGYTFSHWTANVDVKVGDATITAGSAIANSATIQEIASNITLTANWTPKSCSITFDKNSGEGGDDGTTATYDAAMPTVTVPTRTGYAFYGYYDDENQYDNGTGNRYYKSTGTSNQKWNKDTTDPTTLYARWTANKYDVTLNHENGDADATVQATFGSNMPTKYKDTETTLVVPERSDYTLGGYYDEIGGGGTRYYRLNNSKDQLVSAHVWNKASTATLYAKWTQSITLDREIGTSGSTGVTATYNSATLGSFNNPTKTGYTFAGYYDGDDGTGNLVINTAQELQPNVTDYTDESGRWIHEGATTLHAKWTANQYNVTLDHENGTPTSLVQATYGAAMPATLKDSETLITVPSKSGYLFNGYCDDVGGVTHRYYNSELTSVRPWNKTSDATLYAWWRQFINLDREGGSSGSGKVIATYHSATLGSFDNPTKTGYTFGGYYDGDDGTGNLVINTDQELQASVTGCTDSDGKWIHDGASVTLHAKWTANTYDIAYKDGGDTEFSGTHEDGYPTTHTYGTATTLKSATKTGYTFGGWYTSSACTGAAVTSLGATAYTDDITLYAKWTIKTYTITLEDGGATTAVSPTSVTATYNSSSLSSAITAPVQSGYTFGGWWTGEGGKSGSKVIGTDGSLQTSVAGYTDGSGNWTHDDDVTLYAKWDVEGGGGGDCSQTLTASAGEAESYTLTTTKISSTQTKFVLSNASQCLRNGDLQDVAIENWGSGTGLTRDDLLLSWSSGANGSIEKTVTWTSYPTGTLKIYFVAKRDNSGGGSDIIAAWFDNIDASCEGGGTTYTVTYNANGADDGTAPVDAFSPYLEDATVTVLGNKHDLTKEGYTFSGWNTREDGNGTSYSEGSTFTITADVTLYAKWVSASGTTITLDANTANHGEAGNQSVTAVKGSALPDFTHTTAATGYQIEGYYTTASGEGTKIIHANKTLVANTAYTDGAGNWNSNEETLTLYARYEPCTYTISYYDQGGSAFSGSHEVGYPTTHTYGTATTLKGATKAGYNFDGWFTTTTCTGDPVTSLGATVYTANINLYAKWTDPTLCSQDGGAESGQTLDTEPKIKKFKKGYTFSVKQGVDANHIVVNTRIIDDDFASIGQVYLLFHSNATTLDEYAYISLGSDTSVISNAVIDLSTLALKDDATRFMNADPILCMSVKYEVDGDGEVRITDRMYFDRENGGCTEPEEGETEAYFDIYHHDDAPEGARTSYEGGNIVVPIRYFRHFEHTGWCAISLPFKVSKVAVYDEDEKQEYDLYPRFTNNSGNVEGYYWLKTFSGNVSLSGFKPAWQQLTYPTNLTGATADEETTLAKNVKPAENTPYVIAFPDGTYYRKNWVIFYGEAFQTIDADFTGESSITLTDGYDYNQVQLQANNTMHASGTLNNIYMIEEGFDYFTRRESATVPAFEAYVIGTAEVQTRYSILRYTGEEENIPDVTDQPTGIENTPPTTAGYDGEVYTVAGIRVAGFANRDEMETLLNNLGAGVYVVRMGTQINKVVVY